MRKTVGRRREAMPRPESAAEMMSKVLARLGGDGRALEFRVFAAYADAVGPVLGRRSAPERMRGTTLYVRVVSSALAHELSALKLEILDKLAATVGPEVVTDIRTRVGPLEGG